MNAPRDPSVEELRRESELTGPNGPNGRKVKVVSVV
jgi:hypothetical protein